MVQLKIKTAYFGDDSIKRGRVEYGAFVAKFSLME
jgi:hypothetical protein